MCILIFLVLCNALYIYIRGDNIQWRNVSACIWTDSASLSFIGVHIPHSASQINAKICLHDISQMKSLIYFFSSSSSLQEQGLHLSCISKLKINVILLHRDGWLKNPERLHLRPQVMSLLEMRKMRRWSGGNSMKLVICSRQNNSLDNIYLPAFEGEPAIYIPWLMSLRLSVLNHRCIRARW